MNVIEKAGISEIKKILVIGAGKGFFETHELIKAINKEKLQYEIIGIVDDDVSKHGKDMEGVKVLGSLDLVSTFKERSDVFFVFAIGSIDTRSIRLAIMKRLQLPADRFVTLIHPRAVIASSAKIGHGCIIHGGTTILPYAELSDFVVVVFNAYVGLYSKVKEYSLITSHVLILNYVVVEKMAFIGVNATIKDGVHIAEKTVVGMGSVVTHDTKCGELVMGNPARSKGIA